MRRALPNASFLAFTGTPIVLRDANTTQVFGDVISIYDVQRAVEDKATVPIYYEGRFARLSLDESRKPHIDPEFETITEGEEEFAREKLKREWAATEALVGDPKRLRQVAEDLVTHWENRLSAMEGKAMIVCMSRRITVAMYSELIRLRPAWGSSHDAQGILKVVMTGAASDGEEYRQHIRSKRGLVVDYLGLGEPLKRALAEYAQRCQGETAKMPPRSSKKRSRRSLKNWIPAGGYCTASPTTIG